MGVSPPQLVNLHRNRRHFVIKLHTWIFLSYFLKTHKFFIAFINILWVSTVLSTPYLFLDTAARLQWPVTHFSTFYQFFFLIMLFNNCIKCYSLNNLSPKSTRSQFLAILFLEKLQLCTYKQQILHNLPVFPDIVMSIFPFWQFLWFSWLESNLYVFFYIDWPLKIAIESCDNNTIQYNKLYLKSETSNITTQALMSF